MNEPGKEIQRYADKAMFDAEPISDEARRMPQVYLIWATPDPLGAVAAFCRMYEGKVTRDLAEIDLPERIHYWEESFKTHLKAPWETIEFHFMVEGVTRAWTHQGVRQRTAVFAQESLRFAVKPDLSGSVRPGPSIYGNAARMKAYYKAVAAISDAYNTLISDGVPAEDARGLLPHDTLTRLHWKTNLRNLSEHMGNRLCTQAQFEWRMVALGLMKAIAEYDHETRVGDADDIPWEPWQFRTIADSPVFLPVCYGLGHCPFTASFDRGCTIRERVERGAFDEIEASEWMTDPRAGWVR